MHVEPHLPLEELKRLERVEKDADRARRMRIIILGIEGWTAPAVAMAVGLSRRICQRWVAKYNAEGLAGLDDRRGQEPGTPLSAEQEEAFRERVAAGPTRQGPVCSLRGKDFQRILAEEFNLLRSLPAVYWLLHRLGYSYLRPRPRHRKADPEVIEAFKREWPERFKKIAADHPGKRLRVYFQDESRFGQQGDQHQRVGGEGLSPSGGPADGVRVPVGVGRRVPRDGPRRRAVEPPAEHEDRQQVPGPVFQDDPRRRARGDAVGRGPGSTGRRRSASPGTSPWWSCPPTAPNSIPSRTCGTISRATSGATARTTTTTPLKKPPWEAWRRAVLDEDLVKSVCAAPYIERATSN